MPKAVLTVPCFNEAQRLDRAELLRLARAEGVHLLFVDDGSTDATLAELQSLAAEQPDKIEVLPLAMNQGKAEAVRQGLQHALASGAEVVGFLDADLATPVDETLRLFEVLEAEQVEVVLGSRVAMAGSAIDRQISRHYAGRIFATIASLVLRERFYDTQCGAKLFRRGPALAAALEQPFVSRWAFDVELLGRLMSGPHALPLDRFVEVPLRQWKDVAGSKLGLRAMARAGGDLVRIGVSLEKRRRLSR